MKLIGVSGKIGTGKNYLSTKIMEELSNHGFTSSEASFATPLKDELSSIIFFIKDKQFSRESKHDILVSLAKKYWMPVTQASTIFSFLEEELFDPKINGYSRSEGVRRALQYLGTDVRRSVDNDYWVKKFHENLTEETDYGFVTDVRFVNEANSIKNAGGLMLRLDPPKDIVAARTNSRDGVNYSDSAHEHISEIALDDYNHFDIVITEADFNVKEITDFILKH